MLDNISATLVYRFSGKECHKKAVGIARIAMKTMLDNISVNIWINVLMRKTYES